MKYLSGLSSQMIQNALYKGISGITLFATVYILVDYLGGDSYGSWIIIYTLFQWILYLDFGIANVLKSKIAELSVNRDFNLIGSFIKSSYKITSVIAVFIFLLIATGCFILDLGVSLNIPHTRNYVNKLFILNSFFFCINFILSIQKSLYIGILRTHIAEQSAAVTQILTLILLVIVANFTPDENPESKLMIVSIISGSVNMAVSLLYTFLFFKSNLIPFKKAEKLQKDNLKLLLSFGSKFMILQALMIVIFSSDIYILATELPPSQITRYDLVTKYFMFPTLIVIAALSYLWPAFAQKYALKDHNWIQSAVNRFNIAILGMIVLLIPFSLICNTVLTLWVGKSFTVPFLFILNVALMTALRIYFTFYANFFNGIGNLNSQMVLMIIAAIFKIPVSIYLLNCNLELSSVVIVSNMFLLMCCVVLPIEAKKKINALKYT